MYSVVEGLGPLLKIVLHHSVEASLIEKTYRKQVTYKEWMHKIMKYASCYSYPFVYYCDDNLNIIGLTKWIYRSKMLEEDNTFHVLTMILEGTPVEHTKYDYHLIYQSYPPISRTDSGIFVDGMCAIPEGIEYDPLVVFNNRCKLHDTYNTYGVSREFDMSKLTKWEAQIAPDYKEI